MRKLLSFAVLLLVLAALACGLPPGITPPPPTSGPVLTEPAATEAPATAVPVTEPPTTEGPTVTSPPEEPSPTAAPTATPLSPPAILSFTADRTTIVQGEDVILSWQATGGTEAWIEWVGSNILMASVQVDPNGGAATFAPTAPGRPGSTEMVLTVRNSASSAEAQVHLTIECAEAPLPELESQQLYANCPLGTVTGNAVYQEFQSGHMVWLEENRLIYVLYADGRYEIYADNFHEGDPESDPAIIPPAGLYQPIRGFGLVWRTNQNVRDGLGWGLAPEQGFQGWSQSYSGSGMHNSVTFIRLLDGSICLLSHFDSRWRFFTP